MPRTCPVLIDEPIEVVRFGRLLDLKAAVRGLPAGTGLKWTPARRQARCILRPIAVVVNQHAHWPQFCGRFANELAVGVQLTGLNRQALARQASDTLDA